MNKEIRFISICGLLGYGYPLESLGNGLRQRTDFLGVDGGSTDPGPYYLGNGSGFVKPMQVKRDLEPALCAAVEHHIPLIIGTAGGSGAAPHLRSFLEVLYEIAAARDLHFRLAIIPADIEARTVRDALRQGRITPCGLAGELTEKKIFSCSHIVAQMGTGPIIRALEGGADIVVAGRCCDTAVFAAFPIMRGFDPGLALHLGKVAECGTLCARPGGANDSLICTLREDYFVVEPASPLKRCTPASVAAHSLYEQPDPNCFYEPEGKVDLSESAFQQFGERSVKVSGSRLVAAQQPSVKLEGASLKGYRSITVAGVRDPAAIRQLKEIEQAVRDAVTRNLAGTIEPSEYTLRFLRYGMDSVMGPLESPGGPPPKEVGLVIDAIATTQELADTVVSLARSSALHQDFKGRKTTAGNLAFPFSPSDLRGGPVYEFSIYHLMLADDCTALFPVEFQKV